MKMLDKIKKFITYVKLLATNKMKIAERIIVLVGLEDRIIKLYEQKKVYLIEVNRVGKDKELERKLVYEINILAYLFGGKLLDINNLSGTLDAYPNKI